MKRTLKSRIDRITAALDRFEEIWNKAARGEKVPAARLRKRDSLTVTSSRRGAKTIHRDAKTGSFASPRSAARIRDTSVRAADSLKRLAKR
jgi:hypothetical protein